MSVVLELYELAWSFAYEPVVKGLELHDCPYDIAIHIVRLQGALPPRVDQTGAAKHDDTQSLWVKLAFCRTTQ